MSQAPLPKRKSQNPVKAAVTWPFQFAYEILHLPNTMKNLRKASEMLTPVMEQVTDFAERDMKAIGRVVSGTQSVSGTVRNTLGRVPLVGRRVSSGEIEQPGDDGDAQS